MSLSVETESPPPSKEPREAPGDEVNSAPTPAEAEGWDLVHFMQDRGVGWSTTPQSGLDP